MMQIKLYRILQKCTFVNDLSFVITIQEINTNGDICNIATQEITHTIRRS